MQRACTPLPRRDAECGFHLQGAGFEQRGFDFFQISLRDDAEPLFKPDGGQRTNGLNIGDGFGIQKGQVAERHFKFTATVLPGDGDMDNQ